MESASIGNRAPKLAEGTRTAHEAREIEAEIAAAIDAASFVPFAAIPTSGDHEATHRMRVVNLNDHAARAWLAGAFARLGTAIRAGGLQSRIDSVVVDEADFVSTFRRDFARMLVMDGVPAEGIDEALAVIVELPVEQQAEICDRLAESIVAALRGGRPVDVVAHR
jgi:hypothetical protein